jgi:hypothetical protein
MFDFYPKNQNLGVFCRQLINLFLSGLLSKKYG